MPAHELEAWKRVFLEQRTRGLKTRSDPEERELGDGWCWFFGAIDHCVDPDDRLEFKGVF